MNARPTRRSVRLRASSDALLGDLERLRRLESEKRALPPDSARFQELSREIANLAARLYEASKDQREQGAELLAEPSEGSKLPIDQIPPRHINEILAEWREAERRLQWVGPGSPEAATARADAARLRVEYQRAHEAARGREPEDRAI